MPLDRQSSFDHGELAPTRWGRTDEKIYSRAVARLLNFIVDAQGAAVSRPGMQFVSLATNPSGSQQVDWRTRRLFPFVVSDSDAMMLEFGPNPNGVRVFSPTGTLLAQFDHEYLPQDHGRLVHLQIGKTIYFVCRETSILAYPVRKLTRTSDDGRKWEWQDLTFDVPAYDGARPALNLLAEKAGSADFPAREWLWWVTQVRKYSDGRYVETKPRLVVDKASASPTSNKFFYTPLETNQEAVYPTSPIELFFGSFGIQVEQGWENVETRVYRGRGRLKAGLLGASPGPQNVEYTETDPIPLNIDGQIASFNRRFNRFFTDEGDTPDYTRPPPAGRNPFFVGGEYQYPNTVAGFGGRVIYGGTLQRPNLLLFSQQESFDNFDLPYEGFARTDSSFERLLISRRAEEIRSMVGTDRLLVFTQNGVWSYELPLDPTGTIDGRLRSEIGATWLQPLVLPNVVLYARSKGNGVRALFFNESTGYTQDDASLLAEHFFLGHEIDRWCYQEDPWGIVWAKRDDGHMLAGNVSPERGARAWSEIITDGEVVDCQTIPGEEEDVTFLIVRRTRSAPTPWVYTIERFATRKTIADVKDAVCLDGAVSIGPGGGVFTGLSHLEGKTVKALVDGSVAGPFVVKNGVVNLGTEVTTKAHVGLSYTVRMDLLDLMSSPAKRKVVKRILAAVSDARTFKAGEDTDELAEWEPRDAAAQWDAAPLRSGWIEVRPPSSWGYGGRVILQQDDPLPLTVYSIIRQYEEQPYQEV